MNPRLFLDLHVLQTVPPANLNRDDNGSPKHATYGGVRRARVSSQAWKRATRKHFDEENQRPVEDRAIRTARISSMLARRLADSTGVPEDAAARIATALLKPLKIKPAQKKAEDTSYLLFFGHRQLDALVGLVSESAPDLAELADDDLQAALADKPVTQCLADGHPLDVALFGRMVADIPHLNVDAATQVAHALSTHEVELEFDYYTAVDDEKISDGTADKGAGMLGTVEFNSATLYRYATLAVHRLLANLGGDHDATATGVRDFLDAFARSMPTGHQNTFAHRTLPHAMIVTVREDQPINLVGAYEKPVRGGSNGIVTDSLERLAEHLTATSTSWGNPPALTVATYYAPNSAADGDITSAFGPSLAFPALLDRVHEATTGWLATGAVR